MAVRTLAATVEGRTTALGSDIQFPGCANGADTTSTRPGRSARSTANVNGPHPFAWA
ncbi:hypothetical protein AB0M95_20250 [Sphaerisporangium sp. NPDC051017]|uniref:hypothetical protein n=1 Tax=Sphaerisporangium sp. NPDC051017 TaxID=3154636 RepID=UPI003437C845